MRILIAEDDLTFRTVLAAVLRKNGHEVVETTDGIEALRQLCLPDAPTLAVLDWMMPGLDGVDVVRRVRAVRTENRPYILILTARGEPAAVAAALDAGADDYLVKPFDADELRARIDVGRRMIDLEFALSARVHDLERALDEIRTLRGFLPICCNCKKIRDDKGYWTQVEVYIREHSHATFTHGICPDCLDKLYPQLRDNHPGT